ncbi:MAG: rhodanese-like domain-containing protein, partial [Gammaproteobacteria bacterium]|nr:rhodanese-like domain-containing protein [Gammaproteobacteria bacterium]
MASQVSQVPAAPSAAALAHFSARLSLETDCWDVHHALEHGVDFVLLDVRGPDAFARAHVPHARHIPHAQLTAARLAGFPPATLFVVYCSGPHCNGAHRAAIRLAQLNRPV